MKKLLLPIFILSLLLPATPMLAQDPANGGHVQPIQGNNENSPTGRLDIIMDQPDAPYDYLTNEYTLSQFIGVIVGAVLGLLGIIFLILMIYAGYRWMTAGGDSEKVSEAQHTIKVAIIGMLIVAGAYAIWQFLFVNLLGYGS